jgi:hypothetical protein
MSFQFPGITNVEFYSGHYLDAVFDGDLKQQFDAWAAAERDHGTRPPHKALDALANRYFQARQDAADEHDANARLARARDFHAALLEALGYRYEPHEIELDANTHLPVLLATARDHRPFLWVLDAPFPPPRTEDHDPLDERPRHPDRDDPLFQSRLPQQSFRELLDDTLFGNALPGGGPRWVLFLSGSQAVLAERNKWLQGRLLRFSFDELFRRRDPAALKAVCGLLHRDVLAPDSGLCLHDTLDENSHKHAFAVSGDLERGIRRALELLANEAVHWRRENKKAVFNDDDFATKQRDESLRWLFRLLFLFYVEARSAEVQTVPMRSAAYRKGYSLEMLRDLELVPLTTEKAQNGHFLHDSLTTLFGIVQRGFPELSAAEQKGRLGYDLSDLADEHGLRVTALHSPLFDDARLDALAGVRFRNRVLQEVLQLLSLSKEGRGRKAPRGRISYAQLGINQLGAVYESLLSYSGFFAQEDLYEVCNPRDQGADDAARADRQSWFVPASRIGDYTDDEIVRDAHNRKVVHPKGTFLYRLAGRHREKSASYYTPEVLTRCLVKYSLKELLYETNDDGTAGKPKFSAAEILGLTICEPAMGSGAFLLEAVDQLADAYLERAQAERGETIPSGEYQEHKRRVKARLATNNCHGVDLNPVAVELGQVSLWLGTMHQGGKCPWFGLRLATGNSLIGARRQVFRTADVVRKGSKTDPNWLGLVPDAVPLFGGDGPGLGEKGWTLPARPRGTIYHFLLPADGMAPFDGDKVVKELLPDAVAAIKAWRKEFTKPFSREDGARLEKLSDAVDRLWAEVCRERSLAIRESSDLVPVWGEAGFDGNARSPLEVEDQEAVARALEATSSAYRRLKLVMDAWCALWFWPLERVGLLPSREVWLRTLELVLVGRVDERVVFSQGGLFTGKAPAQGSLALAAAPAVAVVSVAVDAAATGERLAKLRALSAAFDARRRDGAGVCGVADVAEVVAAEPMLGVVEEVAGRLQFHHWELRFAEVFAARGGFDLILGNPPWINLEWNEAGVLGDSDPRLVIRQTAASEVRRQRSELLRGAARTPYLEELTEMQGTQSFLSALQMYPSLQGVRTNLYKCFLAGTLWEVSPWGVAGIIHQDGFYNDPKGGVARAGITTRLGARIHFSNRIKLFPAIHHEKHFEFTIVGHRPRKRFTMFGNVFHPLTVDQSFTHDGRGEVPGIKNDQGDWDLRCHKNRVVHVDEARMRLFAQLLDEPGTPPWEARLPVLMSEHLVSVLEKFASQPRRLGDLRDQYFATQHWNETSQQTDGTIRAENRYATSTEELIYQGPHFFVGNPLYQTPNEGCSHNQDYSPIDLESISADYLPRTNYVPACDRATYASRTPKWKGRPVTDFYRHINRRKIAPTGERTLIPSLIPPGAAHVDGVLSCAAEPGTLLDLLCLTSSLPFDYFVKSTGKGDCRDDLLSQLPFLPSSQLARLIMLRLTCVTRHFAAFWNEFPAVTSQKASWPVEDRRFRRYAATKEWQPSAAIRTNLEQRYATVLLDVLAAKALGLTLDELLTIYRIQFPVLQQYERENLYDQHGRLVPTAETANEKPCVNLVKLAALLHEQTGFDIHREYHPTDPDTEALLRHPIKLPKRDADILQVPERCTLAALLSPTEVRWSSPKNPAGQLVPLLGLRYTDAAVEPSKQRAYPTPWTRHSRESDYRMTWYLRESHD